MDYIRGYKYTSDISKVFIKYLEKMVRNRKVIDLGCGQGDYIKYFGKGSLGLDISPENLRLGKKKGVVIRRADLNHPPKLKSTYEIVFSSHVIEHLENPVAFLSYTNTLLKRGGSLILSFPNEHSVICLKYPYFNGKGNHLYSFTIRNMKELLEYTGYKVRIVYRDYYSAATRKLGIDSLLPIFDIFPVSVKNYFAWAFWIVAEKK